MADWAITDDDRRFMKMACDLASENIDCGGGPFGTVIVKAGEVIAVAGSSVALDNDPTAHATLNAIRLACGATRDLSLEGCVVYCSCEPCSMCLSALYLAGVSRVYFGNTVADAERINFGGKDIYKEMGKPCLERSIPCIHIEGTTAIDSFDKWLARED